MEKSLFVSFLAVSSLEISLSLTWKKCGSNTVYACFNGLVLIMYHSRFHLMVKGIILLMFVFMNADDVDILAGVDDLIADNESERIKRNV